MTVWHRKWVSFSRYPKLTNWHQNYPTIYTSLNPHLNTRDVHILLMLFACCSKKLGSIFWLLSITTILLGYGLSLLRLRTKDCLLFVDLFSSLYASLVSWEECQYGRGCRICTFLPACQNTIWEGLNRTVFGFFYGFCKLCTTHCIGSVRCTPRLTSNSCTWNATHIFCILCSTAKNEVYLASQSYWFPKYIFSMAPQ